MKYIKGITLIVLGSTLLLFASAKMKSKKAKIDIKAKVKEGLGWIQELL